MKYLMVKTKLVDTKALIMSVMEFINPTMTDMGIIDLTTTDLTTTDITTTDTITTDLTMRDIKTRGTRVRTGETVYHQSCHTKVIKEVIGGIVKEGQEEKAETLSAKITTLTHHKRQTDNVTPVAGVVTYLQIVGPGTGFLLHLKPKLGDATHVVEWAT